MPTSLPPFFPLDPHDAERLEHPQGLADRDPADAESLRQLGLGREPVAGRQIEAHDLLDDGTRDLVRELGRTQPLLRDPVFGAMGLLGDDGSGLSRHRTSLTGTSPQPMIFPTLPGIGLGFGSEGPARSTVR